MERSSFSSSPRSRSSSCWKLRRQRLIIGTNGATQSPLAQACRAALAARAPSAWARDAWAGAGAMRVQVQMGRRHRAPAQAPSRSRALCRRRGSWPPSRGSTLGRSRFATPIMAAEEEEEEEVRTVSFDRRDERSSGMAHLIRTRPEAGPGPPLRRWDPLFLEQQPERQPPTRSEHERSGCQSDHGVVPHYGNGACARTACRFCLQVPCSFRIRPGKLIPSD